MVPSASHGIFRGRCRCHSFNVEKTMWLYPTYRVLPYPTHSPPKKKKREKAVKPRCCLTECWCQATERRSWATLGSSLWTRKPPLPMNEMTLLLSWYSWSTRVKCKAKVLVWCRVLCPEKVPVVFPIRTRTLPLDVVSKARTDLPDFP